MIDTNDILKIVVKYCKENKISLSKYAQLAGVSKAWISRMLTEKDKKISLTIAQQLLSIAGYKFNIVTSEIRIKRLKK